MRRKKVTGYGGGWLKRVEALDTHKRYSNIPTNSKHLYGQTERLFSASIFLNEYARLALDS